MLFFHCQQGDLCSVSLSYRIRGETRTDGRRERGRTKGGKQIERGIKWVEGRETARAGESSNTVSAFFLAVCASFFGHLSSPTSSLCFSLTLLVCPYVCVRLYLRLCVLMLSRCAATVGRKTQSYCHNIVAYRVCVRVCMCMCETAWLVLLCAASCLCPNTLFTSWWRANTRTLSHMQAHTSHGHTL